MWCIGNHGVYRDGAFQQYVHMIEIAANGALHEELALVRERGARLHVIRPRVPLPLDPDFFLGRIDAATLIAMGYRDAVAYLDAPDAGGVTPDGSATRMHDPMPGVAFRERLSGGGLELRLGWEVDDLDAFAAEPRGTLVGDVTHPAGHPAARARGPLRGRGGRVERRARRSARTASSCAAACATPIPSRRGSTAATGRLERAATADWRTLHARGVGSTARGRAGARCASRAGSERHAELVLDRRRRRSRARSR